MYNFSNLANYHTVDDRRILFGNPHSGRPYSTPPCASRFFRENYRDVHETSSMGQAHKSPKKIPNGLISLPRLITGKNGKKKLVYGATDMNNMLNKAIKAFARK